MPLGIVSDDVFESELSNSNNKSDTEIVKAEVIDHLPRGRSPNDNNVPDSLRKIIGEESIESGRRSAVKLGNEFGISHDSVDAYANGSTSLATYNQPKPDLKNHLTLVKERIANRASSKLISALDSITKEKLADTKPTEAAGIAKDMSVIIKNMEPESDNDKLTHIGPNFVFFSPRQKSEADYEVIDAGE